MNRRKSSRGPRLPAADEPGAPGPVPYPDHHVDIPAAPATHPPEPPVVPSESAVVEFWNAYGPVAVLIAIGLLLAAVLLAWVGG